MVPINTGDVLVMRVAPECELWPVLCLFYIPPANSRIRFSEQDYFKNLQSTLTQKKVADDFSLLWWFQRKNLIRNLLPEKLMKVNSLKFKLTQNIDWSLLWKKFWMVFNRLKTSPEVTPAKLTDVWLSITISAVLRTSESTEKEYLRARRKQTRNMCHSEKTDLDQLTALKTEYRKMYPITTALWRELAQLANEYWKMLPDDSLRQEKWQRLHSTWADKDLPKWVISNI